MKTVIVGKVSIRVWPDTKGFRKKLQADVKAASEGIDAEIPITTDDGLRNEVAAEVEKVNAQAKTNDALQVEVPLELRSRIRQIVKESYATQKAAEAFFKANPVQIRTELDRRSTLLDSLREQLSGIKERMAVSIEASKKSIKKMQSTLKKDPVEVHIAPDLRSIRDTRAVTGRLFGAMAAASKRSQEIPLDFDFRFNKRTISQIKDDIHRAVGTVTMPNFTPKVDASQVERALKKSQIDKIFKRAIGNPLGDIKLDPNALIPAQSLNLGRLRAQMKRPLKDAKASMERSLRDVRVGVRVVARNLQLAKERSAIQKYLDKVRTKISPVLDSTAARWAKAELGALFDRVKAKVKVALDKDSLAKARTALAATFNNIKVKIKAVLDNRSVRNVGTAFAALSGLRLTKTLFDPSILKNLDKMLPMIGLIATGIGQAIALISVMIQNVLSLSASLAQIGPAALALPGIFAGLAVGAIAMGVALADINKRVPEIKAGLSRVANIIRAKFWTQAQAPMKELARRWMPIIETGMGKVARSGGAFFGNLANDLRKIVTPNLGGWFDAVAKGLQILKQGTPGIAKIVRGFGDLGAIYLPRLSRALTSGLSRLGDWITKAVDSGAALAWIDNAIFQIKELGRVIGNAWTFFKGLGKAAQAAGGTTLTSLADSLGRLSEAVNSVSGQEKLIRFFKSMNDAMDAMYRTAGPGMTAFFESLNSLLPALMPLIGETAGLILGALGGALSQPEVGLGLIRFFDGLREALILIGPSFNTLGSGLGALLGLLGTMATSFAPILKIALEGVGRSAEGIVLAVGNLISSLSSGVQAILIAIMPAIQKIAPLVTEFVNRLATQLGQFLERIAPIAGRVFEALAGALAKVLPFLSTLIDVLLPALEWGFRILEPVITGALDAIGQLAEGLDLFIQGVAEMDFGKMWEGLKKALGSLITIFKAPLDAVTVAIGGWVNVIKIRALAAATGFLAQLVSLPGKVGAIFAALVALAKAKVEEMKAAIIAKATQMASDFARKIQDLKDGAVKIMRSVPDALKGALGNLGSLLVNSGRSLLDGLARGIRDGIGGAVRAATDAMGAIRRLFPSSPAKEGPFSGKGWTLYSGRAISASLAEGIRDDLSEARRASEELALAAQVPISGASFGMAATRAVQSALEAEARLEQDAPLTIGNLSIGPDDPEYAEFIEFARKLRRKARQAGG